MCTYLDQVGSTYYFRRVVPVELRPFIRTATGRPRSEWKISLGTKDRAEAKRLIPDHAKATEALLDAAKIALVRGDKVVADPAALPDPFGGMTQEQFEQQQEFAREVSREIDARDQRKDDARAWLADLPPDHPAHLIRGDYRERLGEYQERERRRRRRKTATGAAGDSSESKTGSPVLSPPDSANATQRTPQGKSAAVTVTGLFNGHVATGALTPAIVKEWTAKINRFVEFLGHDDAARVTTDDIRAWRNHVRDEELPGGKRRSAQTVNSGYLSPIRSAFKHGVEEGLIPRDPAKDVARAIQARAAKIREKDFTREEQQTILAAASKIDTSGDGGRQALVRRWVPWICAYTGARVNEITQLRAEDVQQLDGHWVIKITPEAGRVKTKEVRYVPVHEHLLEMGLLTLVNKQKAGPIFYDPERGDPESERGQYKKAGERLAAWVQGFNRALVACRIVAVDGVIVLRNGGIVALVHKPHDLIDRLADFGRQGRPKVVDSPPVCRSCGYALRNEGAGSVGDSVGIVSGALNECEASVDSDALAVGKFGQLIILFVCMVGPDLEAAVFVDEGGSGGEVKVRLLDPVGIHPRATCRFPVRKRLRCH